MKVETTLPVSAGPEAVLGAVACAVVGPEAWRRLVVVPKNLR